MGAGTIEKALDSAAQTVESSDALFVTAGAGMGVDSGLPDFRGDKGFWQAYPMAEKLGLSFVDLANPRWFDRNPKLAWGFYGHRLNLYRATVPHRGFKHLLALASGMPGGYFVYTSNVDGQFQKAGYDVNRIVECHGSIHHLQCTVPCSDIIWPAGLTALDIDADSMTASSPLPTCPLCGAPARPNILMFNDADWIGSRTEQQEWKLHQWWQTLMAEHSKLVVIELGAGTAVPTVRRMSESIAVLRDTATLIRINPREPETPTGHIAIPLGAEEGLLRILGLT